MKLPFYTQAPGLDRFSEKERFAVYLSAHRRLMRMDTTYRGRCRSYWASMVCLSLVPVLGWAILLGLAFRQQHFQNQRIGEFLNGTA